MRLALAVRRRLLRVVPARILRTQRLFTMLLVAPFREGYKATVTDLHDSWKRCDIRDLLYRRQKPPAFASSGLLPELFESKLLEPGVSIEVPRNLAAKTPASTCDDNVAGQRRLPQ